MDLADADLSEWVAVKSDIFCHEKEEKSQFKFICGWNHDKQKIAIIYHEGSRKASDQHLKNKACLLSVNELHNIHQQLCLVHPVLESYFPDDLRPSNKLLSNIFWNQSKVHDNVSKVVEEYLNSTTTICSKKLILALLFDDDDPLGDYEENINEMKLRTHEDRVKKSYEELNEILELRKRAETLLEMSTVYALEDEVVANISIAVAELYNFQLHPFIELRELAHQKVNLAKTTLKEEVGPNIKKMAKNELEDWQEQSLAATEAIQQLNQEYCRKILDLVTAQRDRMIQDKKRYGKAAFELQGLARLQKLDVFVSQERLKLLNVVKGIKEFHRDKIKQQLACIQSTRNVKQAMEEIEGEIYEAQISVLNCRLDILVEEERLYKKQLAILNKEWQDNLDIGIFYDTVENVEDLESIDCSSPEPNPKVYRLKEKLNCLYRKRAIIRNRKKALEAEEKKKKERKMSAKEEANKQYSSQKFQERRNKRELSSEKIKEERKKTVQRLKLYKQKYIESSSRSKNFTVDAEEHFNVTEQTLEAKKTKNIKQSIESFKMQKKKNKPMCTTTTSFEQEQFSNDVNSISSLNPTYLPPSTDEFLPPPPPSLMLPSTDDFLPLPPPPLTPSSIDEFLPPPPLMQPPIENFLLPPPPPPVDFSVLSSYSLKQIKDSNLSSVTKELEISKKEKTTVQPVNIEEILSVRSKLKKASIDSPKSKPLRKGSESSTDFSTLLQSTMMRIRHMTKDSDLESDSDSSFDFD